MSYIDVVVKVGFPSKGHDGYVNVRASNHSTNPGDAIYQFVTLEPIVVDRVENKNKDVDIAASPTSVEARFNRVPSGQQASVAIYYHQVADRTQSRGESRSASTG
jgi:hypothetical protein